LCYSGKNNSVGFRGGLELDWRQAIITGLVMAVAAFVITRLFGKKVKKWFSFILVIMAFLPFLMILLVGYLDISGARATSRDVNAALSKTIMDYLVLLINTLPGMLFAELIGGLIGGILGFMTGRSSKNFKF
jgi:energy-coupling factor transporter transmembrane protein EcfT